MEKLGLKDRLKHLPNQLSGGQQQRVSIGRALINHPALLLADEPTGNLDPETGKGLVDLLHSICKNEDTTIIMATHNLTLLETHPGHVWHIGNHELTCQSDFTSANSRANCSNTSAAE